MLSFVQRLSIHVANFFWRDMFSTATNAIAPKGRLPDIGSHRSGTQTEKHFPVRALKLSGVAYRNEQQRPYPNLCRS
jgi:hypothetical protein